MEMLPCRSAVPVMVGNISYAIDSVLERFARHLSTIPPAFWSDLRRLILFPRSAVGRADVVFTNFFVPVNPLPIPLVLESDFFVYGQPTDHALVQRWLHIPSSVIARTNLVTVRHELSRAAFQEAFPDQADKAVVVPYYFPFLEAVERPAVVEKFTETQEIRVLFVGNLGTLKGLPFLVEAYRLLRQSGRRLQLTVVSEFRDGKIAMPSEIQVYSHLRPGEVYGLMARAHIFAMPTRREPTGRVFWEAMANGCALLVPDVSPQRELFGDYGAAASPTEARAIADALDDLMSDRDRLLTLALQARDAFSAGFHHRLVGKRYRSLFERAVKARSSSANGRLGPDNVGSG